MHPRYRLVFAEPTHVPALPAIERGAAVLLADYAPPTALAGTTHTRRGIGAALLEAVLLWARDAYSFPLSLTTFRDAPFNAPFYARHGFAIVDAGSWTPALRTLVDEEHARGLDQMRRVVMQYRPQR